MNEGEIRTYIEKNLTDGYTLSQIDKVLKNHTNSESEYKQILSEYKYQENSRNVSDIAKGKKILLLIILGLQFTYNLFVTILIFWIPNHSFMSFLGLNVLGKFLILFGFFNLVELLFSLYIIIYIIKDFRIGYTLIYILTFYRAFLNLNLINLLIQSSLLYLIFLIRKEKFNSNKVKFWGFENIPILVLTIWVIFQTLFTYAITYYVIKMML